MGKTVITYGTFDLFHLGHQRLLEHARELGDRLIVGITSDAFDLERGKLDVKQPLIERIHAVEASGLADEIVIEEFKGQKIEDIKKHQVDVFAIGSDWDGKFDYLKEYCEVVYLPRTQGISSTQLRNKSSEPLRLACLGIGEFTDRVMRECAAIHECHITGKYQTIGDEVYRLDENEYPMAKVSFDELAQDNHAVYICAKALDRGALVRHAIDAGMSVVCEGPIALSKKEAEDCYRVAESRNLVITEMVTVLYLPGFIRLKLLLESGLIGEIKDIDASYSLVDKDIDYKDRFDGSIYRMASRSLLPAMSLLGTEYVDAHLICGYKDAFCTWTKCTITYKTASATLKTGRGTKTEGDMAITGTDGYVYVPAPWWLPEYFEVRGEDLRNTKKYYYEYAGEGQRYFLRAFADWCLDYESNAEIIRENNVMEISIVELIERLHKGDCLQLEDNSERFGGGEQVNEVRE